MAQYDQIATQLQLALDRGALPPEGQAQGQRLLDHLSSPTRIAVIGFAGSGKTSLINMLLGQEMMPALDGIAVSELTFGPAPRVSFEMPDGAIRTREGRLDPAQIPAGTFRISQELPDERLRARRYLEITLPEHGADQHALLHWTAKRADIAFWCTQQFNDLERASWANVPDHLKDHSFLTLTMADRLHMRGELPARIAALQAVAAEEFFRLFPVATRQAIAARTSGPQINEKLWQTSGGKSLADALQQQIDVARMADLDHVQLLLERYSVKPLAPEPPPAPVAPLAAAPRPEAAAPQAGQRPRTVTPAANTNKVIDRALDLLQGCALDLLNTPDATAPASDRVLERCSEAADELVTLLNASEGQDSMLDAFREDAIEGEQMLMLLRLERGPNAAADALTVLVQMKKDMAERFTR